MIRAGVQRAVSLLFGRPLRWVGFELQRVDPAPWDAQFRDWVRKGERRGVDPNDVGNEEWRGTAIGELRRYCLPHIDKTSVVLELGPGTGRQARYVIDKCARMILVDRSRWVCRWLERYLAGKGELETHYITAPQMPGVRDDSVDFAFATGVFEHLNLDETLWFLDEFARVVRPGGRIVFNFDNLMSDAGLAHLRAFQLTPGVPNVFRYYHPESMRRLAESAGFRDVVVHANETRFCYLEAMKPTR